MAYRIGQKKACSLFEFFGTVRPTAQPSNRQLIPHWWTIQAPFLQPGTSLFVQCCTFLRKSLIFDTFLPDFAGRRVRPGLPRGRQGPRRLRCARPSQLRGAAAPVHNEAGEANI